MYMIKVVVGRSLISVTNSLEKSLLGWSSHPFSASFSADAAVPAIILFDKCYHYKRHGNVIMIVAMM